MIEVFKTNVQENDQARLLIDLLQEHFPGSKINFDLDDCDKILRIEGHDFIPLHIMRFIKNHGYVCSPLE